MLLNIHCKDSEDKMLKNHVEVVRELSLQIKNGGSTFTLDKHVSNVIRSMDYKKNGLTLDIKKLNRAISLDREKQTILVEPRVSMEQLFHITNKVGCVAPVIPEFKGITVGGAIMGAAIESSSHIYGQFNDTCIGYEILLGNGEAVWATPEKNADLFYAIPGSYGSLGIITLAAMQLKPAVKKLILTYHSFQKISDAMQCLITLKNQKNPPEHLEGIIFSKSHAVIVEGRKVFSANTTIRNISLKHAWSSWFYQHVRNADSHYTIDLEDYLFRHDRGAFWMGSYATDLSLFLRYLIEGVGGYRSLYRSWDRNKYTTISDPSLAFRSVFGWIMSSQRLYGLLHSGSENWFEEKFVIQDFYLPENNAERFVNEVLDSYPIYPIWLCPVKGTTTPQIFSPHYSPQNIDFIDIGLYGLPKSDQSISAIIRDMEQKTQAMGGRKMFYSHSYYTPDEFWNIYHREEYLNLRLKYHAEGTWLDIESKLLKK